MARHFIVYDGETEIYRGTATQIEAELGFRARDIGNYAAQGYLFNKRYSVREIGDTNHEETLAYILKNLKEHGNTVLGGGYTKEEVGFFLKEAEELEGIRAKYRVVKYPEDRKAWYVIEAAKKKGRRIQK